MRSLLLCPTVVMLLTTALIAQEGNSAGTHRTVSTNGEAVVYVRPDEVVINLGVETFNSDLDRSKADNDERSGRLLKAIKSLDIEDKHIQTDTLNIEIVYKDNGRVSHGIDGYLARRGYSITLKDTKLFEKLIDTALKNGANRLAGFEFRTTELRKHRDEARKMAIKAAREKAVALAGELEMKVGKPRTISEGYQGYSGYRGWLGWSGANVQMSQNAMQVAPGAGAADEGGETMPLGQIAVRASVSVTFDLE